MTDAYRFFRSLEQHMKEALPGPAEVATSIADIVRSSKACRSDLHKSFSEGALLNHYVLPAIHDFVSQPRWNGSRQGLREPALGVVPGDAKVCVGDPCTIVSTPI